MSKAMLAWEAPLASTALGKVLANAQNNGFLALVTGPLTYPEGFAFCFIDVPAPQGHDDAHRLLCSMHVASQGPFSELVVESAVRNYAQDQLPFAIAEPLRRFGSMIGTVNHQFVKALDTSTVVFDREQPMVYSRQLTHRHFWALGRIAERAGNLKLVDGPLSRTDVIFREKLKNTLHTFFARGGEERRRAS